MPIQDEKIDAIVKGAAEELIRMHRKLWLDGYNAGREDALKTVLAAFQEQSKANALVLAQPKTERAARGSVRKAVTTVLRSRGEAGAITSEISRAVENLNSGISGVSASNELQRQKDVLYRQDDEGRWHLTPQYVAQLGESARAEK